MKRIKVFVMILYITFVVEILGAWSNTPKAKETAAFTVTVKPQMIMEENEAAATELAARVEYANIKAQERIKRNEYYSSINEEEEKEREYRLETERQRKERIREKKREERRILERIVEAEAGDQDLKGRILVANVIMNRVKSKRFPDSIKAVVFAHRQFSPIQNGRYYRVTVSQKTKKAVKKALEGKDYSEGAL